MLFVATGCGTVAKATGRFAVGTLTSGGSVTAGAQNAAVGAAVDLAAQPKGGEVVNAAPKIVTVYSAATGLQKIIPWREGLTVYSARRTAQMTGAVGLCQIERGDETLESNFRTTLEPGDVL
ncbi:uncharacterized protein METZ01_LOCUS294811, partial [marine metagenome]